MHSKSKSIHENSTQTPSAGTASFAVDGVTVDVLEWLLETVSLPPQIRRVEALGLRFPGTP